MLTAAAPEYRAGAAQSAHVRAAAIEDRRGRRAVFADADFPITRALSDFVAVQLVKCCELDRAEIVLSGTGPAAPDTAAIVTTIRQALSKVAPAALSGTSSISARTADGCFTIPLRSGDCANGPPIHGPIRAAFQMIDLPHPLQPRDIAPKAYPVQAIAIGRLTLLALGGGVPSVVTKANDTPPRPDDPRVQAAIANILKRVR